ncbi:MAG: hypothetical protein M0Z84_02860 [Gammaproteobacteria bacterium]|nr:hypothetical protein [Gammaproteobacteria bacterium]
MPGATAFYPLHKRLFEVGLCDGRNLADEAALRAEAASLGLDPQLPNGPGATSATGSA